MTTRWVNNNRDGGNRYVQLPNKTSITVTNGSQMIGYEVSLRMGQRIQMATPGPHETFRIINTTGVYVIDRNWPGMTGGTLTGWAPVEYDGQTEAHALISINEALSYASGDDTVNVKWSHEGYVLSRQDQIAEVIDVQGSGSVLLNKQLVIEGYKDNVGDMRPDGLHYQSPWSAKFTGIDSTKKVIIDGNNAMANLLNFDGVENIVCRNFLFKNSTSNAIADSNTPRAIMFSGCVFEDVYSVINLAADCEYIVFDDCFVTGVSGLSTSAIKLGGSHHRVTNSILELTGDTSDGINAGDNTGGNGCFISNNLILNGKHSIRLQGSAICINNTLYNPVDCINVQGVTDHPLLTAYNNIFMPALVSGYGIAIDKSDSGTATGSVLYNDYNCFWSVDGQQLTNAFYNGYPSGTTPVVGANSIQVDPMLTGDYRPRNGQVLRGGKADIHGNAGQVGAVLSEYRLQRRSIMGRSANKRFFR